MASQLLGIKTRFTNDLGSPLVGGQVYTYFAGTSTNQDSYSDAALTVPNTNPVILDDTGSADIFLKGAYRIRVFDKSGRFIEEQDNVTQAASQGDATELSNKVNAVEVDLSKVKLDTGITVTAKFGGVERTQAGKNAEIVSIEDFYETSWSQALTSALTSSFNVIRIPDAGVYELDQGVTVVANNKTIVGNGTLTVSKEIDKLELIKIEGDNICIKNVNFDGRNILTNAVKIIGNGARVLGCTFRNLSAYNTSAVAVYIVSDGAFELRDNLIENLRATADSELGAGPGMSRGFAISRPNGASDLGVIKNNIIKNCMGQEGDSITVHSPNNGRAFVLIQDNIIHNWSRRAIKLQAHDVKIINNEIINTEIPTESYRLQGGISLINTGKLLIKGNTITGFGVAPINGFLSYTDPESTSNYKDIHIQDNLITVEGDEAPTHIYFSATEFTNLSISGNNFNGGSQTVLQLGVQESYIVEDNIFNVLDSDEALITLASSNAKDIVVSKNILQKGTRSSFVNATNTPNLVLIVSENKILNSTPLLFVSTAPTAKNIITGNVCYKLFGVARARINSLVLGNAEFGDTSESSCLLYCDTTPKLDTRLGGMEVKAGLLVKNSKGGDPQYWEAMSDGIARDVEWTERYVLSKSEVLKVRGLP